MLHQDIRVAIRNVCEKGDEKWSHCHLKTLDLTLIKKFLFPKMLYCPWCDHKSSNWKNLLQHIRQQKDKEEKDSNPDQHHKDAPRNSHGGLRTPLPVAR